MKKDIYFVDNYGFRFEVKVDTFKGLVERALEVLLKDLKSDTFQLVNELTIGKDSQDTMDSIVVNVASLRAVQEGLEYGVDKDNMQDLLDRLKARGYSLHFKIEH